MTTGNEIQRKLQEIDLLEQQIVLKEGLPHLYGMNWYDWAWDFFISVNRYNFLCAANQVSKSSTQIRKSVHWATAKYLWAQLWKRRPLQFWYLYPTREVATIEFEKKWVEEWLPKSRFHNHPTYGWKPEFKNKLIWAIHFNTGVSQYFKTYGTDVSALQTGSVDAIFCDEELPWQLYPELNMRIAATWGYFHMVFTATLGQEEWRLTMEENGKHELFPNAFKRQISMYDCLKYRDGSLSHWTEEKIEEIKNSCGTEAEILRRVYGKFVKDSGLKYPSFSRLKNIKPFQLVPSSWLIYAGIDVGSGGETGHPAAITFVAVRPDYQEGRIFRGWRGDGVITTAMDVLLKYIDMSQGLNIIAAYYDYGAAGKDFGTMAQRMGIPVLPAEKSHDRGEHVLNTLFKGGMLSIYDTEELKPLTLEFCSLQKDTPKTKAKDDFVDSARYAVVPIPWDFSAVQGMSPEETESKTVKLSDEELGRRGLLVEAQETCDLGVLSEMKAWNELYDP